MISVFSAECLDKIVIIVIVFTYLCIRFICLFMYVYLFYSFIFFITIEHLGVGCVQTMSVNEVNFVCIAERKISFSTSKQCLL